MDFDLWTLLVEQLIGGFWLTVLVMVALIFLIMAILGKMSKITVTYYIMLFVMTMTIGFGNKFLSTLLGIGIMIWVWIEIARSTTT